MASGMKEYLMGLRVVIASGRGPNPGGTQKGAGLRADTYPGAMSGTCEKSA